MHELENFGVNITPTALTVFPKRTKRTNTNTLQSLKSFNQRTAAQRQNEANLKENNHKGKLSLKAAKRLRDAVNWLISISDEQSVNSPCGTYRLKFRLNMITLTLPFLQGEISDNFIKSKFLNPFLTHLRLKYGLTHYVWKAETQKNGNIHFHLITNTYIHHFDLRRIWNAQIKRNGLMKDYTSKFIKMNYKDYLNYSKSQGVKDVKLIYKRFLAGKTSGWEDPNTTDVHSLRNVKNVGAYVAAYMAKKEKGRRGVTGRIWGTSESLAASRKLTTYIDFGDFISLDDIMELNDVKFKSIEVSDKSSNKVFIVARVYFIDLRKLLRISRKWLQDEILFFLEEIKSFYQKEKLIKYNV